VPRWSFPGSKEEFFPFPSFEPSSPLFLPGLPKIHVAFFALFSRFSLRSLKRPRKCEEPDSAFSLRRNPFPLFFPQAFFPPQPTPAYVAWPVSPRDCIYFSWCSNHPPRLLPASPRSWKRRTWSPPPVLTFFFYLPPEENACSSHGLDSDVLCCRVFDFAKNVIPSSGKPPRL